MKLFEHSTSALDGILNGLFETYSHRVPDVQKITRAMVEKAMVSGQKDIVNDHIAFRTMGVPNLGLASFEKIFLQHGYTRKEAYAFEMKKLDAYWYAPPSPKYPRIFISELRVKDLSEPTQKLIRKYTDTVTQDPVDTLDLNDVDAVVNFLHTPLWQLPTKRDYQDLLSESEYASWVIYNRYYLNHYTISVHALPSGYNTLEEFNRFLVSLGIRLNDAGGVVKKSGDGLLLQSSSVSQIVEAEFAEGETMNISGSYVEFAERKPLPEFAHIPLQELQRHHRREGFEASNADKIFESTYSSQTGKRPE